MLAASPNAWTGDGLHALGAGGSDPRDENRRARGGGIGVGQNFLVSERNNNDNNKKPTLGILFLLYFFFITRGNVLYSRVPLLYE